MAHSNQAHFCVVEGCALDGNGHHTCSAHATVKDYHNAGGRVMFTLCACLQWQVTHPKGVINVNAPADEDYKMDTIPSDACPEKQP